MRTVTSFPYLDARISLFAGRLLSREQLLALMQAAESGEEPMLERAGLAGLSLPLALRRPGRPLPASRLLAEVAVLIRPMLGAARELFSYFSHHYELANLKAIFRGKVSGVSPDLISRELWDTGAYARLPTAELLQAEDVGEALRRLERVPQFREIAHQVRRIHAEHGDLFTLDASLDRRYYTGLARRAELIPARVGARLRDLVGTVIDRINIVWLLRYRFAYGLPAAETYYHLVHHGLHLDRRGLRRLATAPDFDAAVGSLPTVYGELLTGCQHGLDVTLRLQEELWRRAEDLLAATRNDLVRPLSYLLLRQRDLERVRGILKAKRLALPVELLDSALGPGWSPAVAGVGG